VGQSLRERCQSLRGVKVAVGGASEGCPVCGGPTRVQKSRPRQGKTLTHGQFDARETVHVCASGCLYPSGVRATRRAQVLEENLLPGHSVGYDTLVFVGTERYLAHRQREEIRTALWVEHEISLSAGEVSRLAVLFLEYLEALHGAHEKELRGALRAGGGYPLHVDATGEDGRGTLLVALAGWRRWVLGAWKLPTERADAIVPCLREVVARFGAPCAIVRDLGRAVTRAVEELVEEEELTIPVLGCHQHFLKDIGKDLLEPSHAGLRGAFRSLKVRPGLRSLARDLGRKLGATVEQARQDVRSWLEGDSQAGSLPKGRAGIAAVRVLAQWVLDYPTEASGADFPFDRPYLDLMNRCMLALRAVEGFVGAAPAEPAVLKALKRLERILAPVSCDVPLAPLARRLSERAALFDELREALRLVPAGSPKRQAGKIPSEATLAPGALQDIRRAVEDLTRRLKVRRLECGAGSDTREGIDLILKHLGKHGHSLWGHEIELPAEVGGGTRLVERTNNELEGFFRGVKHDERRRSGRKVLTQDFEHLPPAATLARNLRHEDYVALLCGSIENLPRAFAQLDAKARRDKLAGEPTRPSRPESPPALASASLPRADKRLVRSEQMRQRILAAAGH
jgi:hypothetical protein